MRKLIVCVLVAATCALAGCGSEEKVISKETTAAVGNQETAKGEEQATQSQEGQADKESAYEGYVFDANGVKIEIDAKAEAILTALGEPTSYFESPSCAFGDLDKIYTFPGFELDTYSLEGVDYVSMVVLLDDSVSTPEGVSIGSTPEEVKQAYGEPTTEKETALEYEKGEMKLCFLIKDGVVASVEYRTKKLDS